MKLHTTLMASCALALVGTTVMADCAAELSQLQAEDTGSGHGQGISKDGSLAPLEAPNATTGSDSAATSLTGSTATPGDGTAAGNRDAAGSTAATSDMAAANNAAASNSTAASDDTASSSRAGGEGIAKDGSLAPLEGTEAETETPRAMSGQDVQAQQEGELTAAESAAGSAAATDTADTTGTGGTASAGAGNATSTTTGATDIGASAQGATTASSERGALIAEAQIALDAGNEDACRAAVEKIKAL